MFDKLILEDGERKFVESIFVRMQNHSEKGGRFITGNYRRVQIQTDCRCAVGCLSYPQDPISVPNYELKVKEHAILIEEYGISDAFIKGITYGFDGAEDVGHNYDVGYQVGMILRYWVEEKNLWMY